MKYPFYVGNLEQQRISHPKQIIYAWCLVSPKMSLFPSKDDVYKILPVEVSLVERSLGGKKLKNPESLTIKYINPFSEMEQYEVIPHSSPRFNIQSIPDTAIIYQELGRRFEIKSPMFYVSSNILGLLFAFFALLSLEENRNN